ncbi:LacI family transcriptional regulator [Cellulomonas sp. SLBN-39]|nr:LacI family transcriptional regulator [Cellulomonas sp. SLBN-39]
MTLVTASPLPRKRATVHDVAREAGVSRGTISRMLNGDGYVSTDARERIEAAIRKVGYVPSTTARNLVRQRTNAVGFVVHEPHALFLEDPNIGAILLGANEALSEADHQMVCLVVGSGRDAERVGRYLRGGFVDGCVVVSAREHDPITAVVRAAQLPVAFVGHPPDLQDMSWVGIDNVTSAHEITSRLLATGRHRVAMIAAALDRDSGADRLAGFRQALGDRFDADLVARVEHYAYSDGVRAMTELLERAPDVDGVFAASDALAAGALEALLRAGRRVPQDVGVVGFDDSAWASRCTPPLSTVRQPAEGLGRAAARSVLAQIAGEQREPAAILLDTPVVWRGSA